MGAQFIQIEPTALEYIKNKGAAVTVGPVNAGKLCCGTLNFAPDVRLGEPSDLENYTIGEVSNVRLYQHRELALSTGVSIGLAQVLGFQYLVINGWKLV